MRFDGMGPNFMIAEKGSASGGMAREGDEVIARSLEFSEESFHFRAGMLVASFLGDDHSGSEDAACVVAAAEAHEELAELLVGGDIVRMRLDEFAEMLFGGGGVAQVHAFDGQAVTGKGVVRFCGNKFFEALAARFLLKRLGHGWEAGIIAAGLGSATMRERG
jgi:hypothetical protein